MNSTYAKDVPNSTHAQDVTVLTGTAACCAVGNAVLHTLMVPDHLEEKFYIGVLFVVGSAIMLAVAAGLVFMKRPAAAWLIGALVSLGMIVGFALSRTVGLPYGYHEDGWEAPYGPLSLLVEGLFVLAFLVRFGARPLPRTLNELRDFAIR
ncbi:hypothetical protein GCM10014715_05180 [Streptomyces spiralis]|uniref:Uncharacterized protein n=1 Tax=Streptomyces spiralis TaxID=66376 RepID=A0A918ZJT5_9ACTN|nr:hypothetical protein [Streptomyces spiralis]GHE55329.1 hypothetical protein GCM10014715_05180 [Streptomyces spiralis]